MNNFEKMRAELSAQKCTGEGAENILDYMTGSERSAAHVLYQKHGFAL